MTIESVLNLSISAQIWVAVIVFIASFVRGYSGFGFSAIFMAGLLPVLPAAQLVPLSILLEILASSSQAPRILTDINRRFLFILLCASLVGAPIGVFLLSFFSERSLRFAVYGVILCSTLALLLLRSRPQTITPTGLVLAGFVAGVVNGATALSGMVLALFFSSSTIGTRTMRATMIAYLFFTDVITAGMLWFAGHYDTQTLFRGMAVVPVMLAGIWLGSRHFFKTPAESFKTRIMWLLLLFCVAGVVQMLLRV